MSRFQEIVQAINRELEIHKSDIERSGREFEIDLNWLSIRVFFDKGSQVPIKTSFQMESVRELRPRGNGSPVRSMPGAFVEKIR